MKRQPELASDVNIYLCSTKKRNCVVIGDRNEGRQSEKETA